MALASSGEGISGLGNAAVTLDDTTVDASELNALDGETSGMIGVSAVTTVTGALSVVRAAYASEEIAGLGNEAVTLEDTTVAAADLNTLNGQTSGVIDASSVETLTGALSDVAAAYAANTAGTISGLGDEAVTLDDLTVAAVALNDLDGETSGVIDASSVETLTGALSDVAAAYAANTAGTISGLRPAARISPSSVRRSAGVRRSGNTGLGPVWLWTMATFREGVRSLKATWPRENR